MTTAAKKTTTAKKTTARKPKPAAAKTNGNGNVTDAEVKRAIALRADGKSWDEVTKAMNKSPRFVLAVRPLMKKMDPKSVAKTYKRTR